ncbi:MAG: hypothetical protein QXL96_06775 [Ignisphaera sp.]
MRTAIVYYSKTGNTKFIVELMQKTFRNRGIEINLFRALPLRDYSKPLHINLRIIYETLIKKGTNIKLEPMGFNPEEYDITVIASPIWFNTLSPPIQQFLKMYANKIRKFMVITTSGLDLGCEKIIHSIEKLAKIKPSLCVNIAYSTIKNEYRLRQLVQEIVDKIISVN